MAAFPNRVNKAIWPRFPDCRNELERKLKRHNFTPVTLEESRIVLFPPVSKHKQLPWLLETGILAGFDQVMPLNDPEISRHFELQLAAACDPLAYHYVMMLGKKL